jgi:hypothetical protein
MHQEHFYAFMPLAWGVIWIGFWIWQSVSRRKERERIYDMLQKATDEGRTLPPEVLNRLGWQGGRIGDFRAGIFWLAVGVGLAVAGYINYVQYAAAHNGQGAMFYGPFGLFPIPTLVGVAFLIVAWLRRNETKDR